jgi:3-methylfumaryl-CoA hydratase
MVSETLVPGPAEGLAGLLGAEVPGESLPLMWHWVYLLERPSSGHCSSSRR